MRSIASVAINAALMAAMRLGRKAERATLRRAGYTTGPGHARAAQCEGMLTYPSPGAVAD